MKRRLVTSVFCTLTLLANGAGALVSAQTQQRVRQMPPPPPPDNVLIDRHVPPPGEPGMPPPPSDSFFTMQIAPGEPHESFNFSFVSSEMHFDSKIVKGAPYSAESVNESVQLLADGNRITRTSKATIYRDSEGRTRREQTLNHIGPWATADDPPQTTFINDPVSGTHYVLNPRMRSAQKMSNVFSFKRTLGDDGHAPGGAERTQVWVESGGKELLDLPPSSSAAPLKAPAAGLSGKAIKKVQPTYPAIAKAAGAQGAVSVQIVVGESGDVETAKAISGHPLLRQAAVDAARGWQFAPTKLSGNAVKVSGTISFNFSLPKEEAAQAGELRIRTPAPGIGHEGERMRVPGAPPVTESLGKQTVEGVEAEGTRTTITIQAGAIGNERPINIVSERWYSPELQTVVMTRHSDPRFGETSYRLTNINRSEPARTLFEVPSDYTVKTDDSHPRRVRMMSPMKVQQQ